MTNVKDTSADYSVVLSKRPAQAKFTMVPPDVSEPDLKLSSVLRIVERHRTLILACVIAGIAASGLYLSIVNSRYRASSHLQVLKEDNPTVVADVVADGGVSEDTLQLNLTMQTDVGVLTSDNLALRVIREQGLEQTPEYQWRPSRFASDEERAESQLPLEQTRYRRDKILRRFRRNLQVSVVSGSRIISVDFYSTDPNRATSVLHQLVEDFVTYNTQVRFDTVARGQDWLRSRLDDLKAELERSQIAAADLQRQVGIYGAEETHNLVLGRLQTLDQEVTNAEQNRIVKKSVLDVVVKGDPEALSSLSSTVGQTTVPGSINSLALIQNLRQQEATLSAQFEDLSHRYGPNFPRLTEVKAGQSAVQARIKDETVRLRNRAANDYQAAEAQERTLREKLKEQRAIANTAGDLAVRYALATQRANLNRDLYQHLLEKSKEVDVFNGLRESNINVLDYAHASSRPVSPDIALVLAMGFGAGLLVGLVAAFLRDSLDSSLYDPDDIQRLAGIPLLGVVPRIKGNSLQPEPSTDDSNAFPASGDGVFEEAFRCVRTAVWAPKIARSPKVLMITSASQDEGKSTVTINLARVLAQQGKRVLLIDGDLRQKTLSDTLGMASASGLSEMVSSRVLFEPQTIASSKNLYFVPSGARTEHPAELLTSESLAEILALWQDLFDYILIDSVSVLRVTDAVAFSRFADGVILVALAGVTSKQSFVRAASVLSNAGAPMVGAILNGIDLRSSDYRHYVGS